ncbi:undecaprenyl-phosphate glucose phosphotransferase [Trinickia dabaoshanensis]|uniref:Undecaprenyl-phosphate glucose phosphotransferase n=1 Tax=Trinickia dabaoshanensis TaxID=564714 RepID=A0A2N7VH77_9BURK|nr:undecaprenyl-phosphate glucose phosphotransferase [Trinickia dabaoshanensis]PMS16504.1 undecaprenyl-phosphate glucose phosphotransferase [Trinickia dabaoshanensis]
MREIQGVMTRLSDVAIVLAGAALASHIRFADGGAHDFVAPFVALTAAFVLVLFPAFGVYDSWRGRAKRMLAGQVALAWFVAQACALTAMFSLREIDYVSRLWFVYWSALGGALLIGYRLAAHAVLARLRHAGINLHQVAIVGAGAHCEGILRRIEAAPATGFRAAAVFIAREHAASAPESDKAAGDGVRRFDDLDAFARYVRGSDLHEVWLALPLSEERTILRVVGEFRDDLVNIRFMPDVRSLALFESGGVIDLLGVPAINLVASPLSPSALLAKALFDRVFAACALIGLAPLLAVIAAAVKLSSPGPVLFKQKRKGADGRVFTMYKFRTMRVHEQTPGVLQQAVRHDPRVTKLGGFLRHTSLDELPQFFNVLRGDMSVVGPRPHALEHDDLYRKVVAGYIHRYRIKPGITGWAQINGYRGETDRIEKMERRVAHDLYYLGNWSFGLDMRIIAATIVKGFVHSNAY